MTLSLFAAGFFLATFAGSLSPLLSLIESGIMRLMFVLVWLLTSLIIGFPQWMRIRQTILEHRRLLTEKPRAFLISQLLAFALMSGCVAVLVIEAMTFLASDVFCIGILLALLIYGLLGLLFQILRPERFYDMTLDVTKKWPWILAVGTSAVLLVLLGLAIFFIVEKLRSGGVGEPFVSHMVPLVVIGMVGVVLIVKLDEVWMKMRLNTIVIGDYNDLQEDIRGGVVTFEEEAEKRFDSIRERGIKESFRY